jgi:hypothetical protein
MNPHGEINLFWEDDILYLEAFGPFNEEGVIKAASEYLNTITKRNVTSFSVIEVWDEDSLSSPEGMEYVGKLWAQLVSNNCISLAVVVSNTVQRDISEQLIPSIGKVFNSKVAAKIWVLNRKII